MKGYIYIGADNSGWAVKIGKTKEPKKREKQIRNMNPTFYFVFLVEVDNMDKTEKLIHRVYAEKRHKSEWFELTSKEIANLMFILTDQDYDPETIRTAIGMEE